MLWIFVKELSVVSIFELFDKRKLGHCKLCPYFFKCLPSLELIPKAGMQKLITLIKGKKIH